MSHPYTLSLEINEILNIYLFFLTFSYHWANFEMNHIVSSIELSSPYAGHVILQLILYKLCSRTYLWAFQPYTLPILSSQLHSAVEIHPNLVSHPYLIFRNKSDIFSKALQSHRSPILTSHVLQAQRSTAKFSVTLQPYLYK